MTNENINYAGPELDLACKTIAKTLNDIQNRYEITMNLKQYLMDIAIVRATNEKLLADINGQAHKVVIELSDLMIKNVNRPSIDSKPKLIKKIGEN